MEIEELIDSLNGSSKRRGDLLTPKKKMKVDSGLSNLSFSFPVDVFKESTLFGNQPSFEEMRPQLRDRITTLSQAVALLGSFFGSSTTTTNTDIGDIMVELGMLNTFISGIIFHNV